jgi:hypothetical protein
LIRSDEGELWLSLPAGVHQIGMDSNLAGLDTVQIGLPLVPHKVESSLSGWTLEGLGSEGQAGESLILARMVKDAAKAGQADQLPPFVHIDRNFSLGLNWTVSTRISRVGAGTAPLVVDVALLPGESVTSEDVKVENGHAMINLGRSSSANFSSVLKVAPNLQFTASRNPSQIESWHVAVGQQWHAAFDGIPVVQHRDAGDNWVPAWQPWPGETVKLTIGKPAAVAGPTFTIEHTRLAMQPGIRATDANLALTIRSSQGGQHVVTLPPDATLQKVSINGAEQPIRQEGRLVKLPLVPGSQQIELNWRESRGIGVLFHGSVVDIGGVGVNAQLAFELPADRWVLLLGGPRMGPAVLFWGALLVLALVAVALGRVDFTPLRGRQWFLLGFGLLPVDSTLCLLVFGWLLLLGVRQRYGACITKRWAFNLLQIAMVVVSLVALSALVDAIKSGLLGTPDMQIRGFDPSNNPLTWYQDRHGAVLPNAWLLSAPMMAYRLLMLLWASWLAWALLGWLKWGWAAFGSGDYWRRKPTKADPVAATAADVVTPPGEQTSASETPLQGEPPAAA